MNDQSENNSASTVFALGFPLYLGIELFIHVLSLLPPVAVVTRFFDTQHVGWSTLAVLLALYLYPLGILLFGALATRLLPKPSLGLLKTPHDKLKYATLAAVSKFVRRTPARWMLIFPFPAYLFYKLAGANIENSVLQGSFDTLPDFYFLSIGKHTLLGWNSSVFCHISPNASDTIVGRVDIGDYVLIGESATVWPNVKIGNHSIVQNKSVVYPGTIIPANEIWGGNPAQKIKSIRQPVSVDHPVATRASVTHYGTSALEALGFTNHRPEQPFCQQGLTAEDINKLLRKTEREFGVFIDRTSLRIETLSLAIIAHHVINQETESTRNPKTHKKENKPV